MLVWGKIRATIQNSKVFWQLNQSRESFWRKNNDLSCNIEGVYLNHIFFIFVIENFLVMCLLELYWSPALCRIRLKRCDVILSEHSVANFCRFLECKVSFFLFQVYLSTTTKTRVFSSFGLAKKISFELWPWPRDQTFKLFGTCSTADWRPFTTELRLVRTHIQFYKK